MLIGDERKVADLGYQSTKNKAQIFIAYSEEVCPIACSDRLEPEGRNPDLGRLIPDVNKVRQFRDIEMTGIFLILFANGSIRFFMSLLRRCPCSLSFPLEELRYVECLK